MEITVKQTPLAAWHEAQGAKMVEFAGYYMPIQYQGVIKEHINVREHVGVFDVSHMGEFMVRGEEALNLVQWVCSNDASLLEDGKVQYSCMPNADGGIVDDLLVYRISEKEYMLVVNASNMQKDWDWIKSQNTFQAEMEDVSDQTALIAVQGPKAVEALQTLTDINLSELKYYTFKHGRFAGLDNILISATGYTGAGGFEIYLPADQAKSAWEAIMKAGEPFHIEAAGLAARDTLRLEMGYCLYGNDIDDTTSPLEAGLGWITKFNKDFVNADYLKKQKEEGTSRRLVGFEMIEKGIPRKGYPILDLEGNQIGLVTSGTSSPSLQKFIGMGYVNKPFHKSETEIQIAIRNKIPKAKIVKLPFYKS
ncbi:MAG: glycine cleavage system aminomethyltransferase GcvT [Bacteroidota bacterium]